MTMPRNFIPGSDGNGLLLVLCLCMENYVWVLPKAVRELRGGVCGRAECRALAEKAA